MNTQLSDFARLLKVLGVAPDEHVSVCYRLPGGRFTSTLGKASDAPARAAVHVGNADVWFGVGPIRSDAKLALGQRGSAEHIDHLPAIWDDLDAKPLPEGLGSTENCLHVVNAVSGYLGGNTPAAVVHSGTGGLHTYRRLDSYPPTEHHRAERLLHRYGVLVKAVAKDFGGSADSVFDAPRILRVVGTVNLKEGGGLVTVEFPEDDGCEADTLTLDRLEELLDEAGIPDTAEPTVGEAGERVEFANWPPSTRTCHYAQAMISGWATDLPKGGRHQWLLSQCVRLMSLARSGCITEEDFLAAQRSLGERFEDLCGHGDTRMVKPLEVWGCLVWARDKVETAALEHVLAELGNHLHPGGEVAGRALGDAQTEAERLRELEDQLFSATPALVRIRDAARSRIAPPWSVLGAVLARVNAEVPPHVVLPPVIFGKASLNLAVALVETSGGGKSGSVALASELLGIVEPKAKEISPGSGEGLIQNFLKWDDSKRQNVAGDVQQALLIADEVAQIGAVQERNGSTSAPVLRTMLTGGGVGTTNATDTRNRQLLSNTYRLAVLSGIQPELSGVLLNDAAAGSPQRWVWLPTNDPDAPDVEPKWPGSLGWSLPDIASLPPSRFEDGLLHLGLPASVEAEIKTAQKVRTRSRGASGLDGLDGHRMLTREKVAATLAWLHGEIDITLQWWWLAGVVMEVSDIARGWCLAALKEKAECDQRGRGRADAVREQAARAVRAEHSERYAGLLWRTVAAPEHLNMKHTSGEGCTSRCLSYALRNHKDADKNSALAVAIDLAWIEEVQERYFPGSSEPRKER